MKISIITVAYNSGKTIEVAIKSVLSQSYNDLEYIVIDGNSEDNTMDIVRSFGRNISVIVSEPDKGIYDAMNKGISMASGDIIGILNSDDLYHDKDVLADIMAEFSNNPDLDIVYGNILYVQKEDTDAIVRKWISKPYYHSFFELGNVPPHTSLFVRSRVYKMAGSFHLQYRLAADYEFMLRIFKKYKFTSKYIDRVMVKMRLGGATNKSIRNIFNGNKEILRAWKDNHLPFPVLLMPLKLIKRVIQFI